MLTTPPVAPPPFAPHRSAVGFDEIQKWLYGREGALVGGRTKLVEQLNLRDRVQASVDAGEEPWDAPKLQREMNALLQASGLRAIDVVRSCASAGLDTSGASDPFARCLACCLPSHASLPLASPCSPSGVCHETAPTAGDRGSKGGKEGAGDALVSSREYIVALKKLVSPTGEGSTCLTHECTPQPYPISIVCTR